MGEEAYFIDLISNYLIDTVLQPEEREFNQTILYGKDAQFEHIISNVRSYPMMASNRLVILREAQFYKDWDLLESYFEKPVPSTIFVICYKNGTPDKRKKIFKKLSSSANMLVFHAARMAENQMIDWIRMYAAQRNIQIDPKAAYVLKEMIGDDLARIAKEVDKFVINLPPGSEVKLEEIANSIGVSREYNTFEFQSAIAGKNIVKANRIAKFFASNPNSAPFPVIVGTLYAFFIKVLVAKKNQVTSSSELRSRFGIYLQDADLKICLQKYSLPQLRNVLHLLHEYDLKSKGVGVVNVNHGELLREFLFRVTH